MSIIAIANNVVDRLMSLMSSGRIAAQPEPTIDAPPANLAGRSGQGWMSNFYRALERPNQRRTEMEFYDYLETELPDVTKALDAFATMACTGTLTGASRGSYAVELDAGAPDELRAWVDIVSDVMEKQCFSVVRGMSQFGSYPGQLVIDRIGDRWGVTSINHLPPGTMYRKIDGGQAKYWEQKSEWNQDAIVTLPRWTVPHFAIWTKPVSASKTQLYGTSILRPIGRLGLQLQSCIDAMVVARLSRACARYKFSFDVSDISSNQPEIIKRMKMYQNEFREQRQVLDTGSFDSYRKAAVPDQDFFMPASKNLAWDVSLVSGDPNVGNIKDIEYITRSYLGALGVPAQYLGHGGSDTGGRSSLTQVDINFARSSRYLQMFAANGFEHMIAVHMLLGGWDPERYGFRVVPPQIGARDELLSAQIRMPQSQVIGNLVKAGLDPNSNPRWVLTTLMNMGQEIEGLSDADLDKLFVEPPMPGGLGSGTATQRPDRAKSAKESDILNAVRRGTPKFIENTRELIRGFREMVLLDNAVSGIVHNTDNAPTVEQLRKGIFQLT